MPSPSDIAKALEKSVEDFNRSIPAIEKQLISEIEVLLKELDVKNGSLKVNAKNIRLIAQIKQRIERVILKNKTYNKNVDEYLKSFDDITKLQNSYFESLSEEYKIPKLLGALREEAKSAVFESLTRQGLAANLSKPIADILRTRITTGAKYSDLLRTVRDYMDETGNGSLRRYSRQVTTDALNQYAASYNDLVANDLGLKWYSYNGAIIETSRQFCEAMHEKKWVHRSEFPDVVKGDFEEFKAIDGKIYDKTGLPQGMRAETDAANFTNLRGGWSCGHQLIPVNEFFVPKEVRDKLKKVG